LLHLRAVVFMKIGLLTADIIQLARVS